MFTMKIRIIPNAQSFSLCMFTETQLTLDNVLGNKYLSLEAIFQANCL